MGWYPTTYIGPYLEIAVKQAWETKNRCKGNRNSCPSNSLEVGAFCSMCGVQAPVFDKVFRPEFGPWDASEKIDEALVHQDTDDEGCDTDSEVKYRFVPNVSREGVNSIRRSGQETCAHDLSEKDLSHEIGAFAEAFSDEIKVLRQHYGNATVKWGIIFSGG